MTADQAEAIIGRLTRRQRDVVRFMSEYQLTNKIPPTMRETQQALRISRATIYDHLQELVRKGALVTRESRGIQRRYRVPRALAKRFAGTHTLRLLDLWASADQKTKREFADYVMSWWASQEATSK